MSTFLDESKHVCAKYGHLLLVGGEDAIPESDLPEQLPFNVWTILTLAMGTATMAPTLPPSNTKFPISRFLKTQRNTHTGA